MTPGRRTLRFDRLDQVMPEVERLLEGGYTPAGRWSLGQTCRHLAIVLRASVDAPAAPPRDPSKLFGEDRTRELLDTGELPEGVPTAPPFDPPAGLDDREEAEGLRAALAHYAAAPGPVVAHPLFGFLPRDEWDRFHAHHAAHHLSFAVPAASAS